MRKLICIAVLLVLSFEARSDLCALPSAETGEPYATLAALSKRELQLVLDEYAFLHKWTKQTEAVAAGFRRGDRVYGEVLKGTGGFSVEGMGRWRRTYEKSARSEFLERLQPKVDVSTIHPQVVTWALRDCIANKTWSRVRVIDDCRFVFTAGLAADAAGSKVKPLGLEVSGARCGAWPERPLTVKGEAVQCVRTGSEPVLLRINTDQGGASTQRLPRVAEKEVPPEPLQRATVGKPVSEVISLWRSRDYRLVQLGKGCPGCGLYSAELRPSDPGAVVVSVATVSSSGAGWQRCPANLRCGVYEFSPVDNAMVSGCTGVSACRIWRLAETDVDASDVVQVTWQRSGSECVNCPAGTDFATAHQQWEKIRDRALASCRMGNDEGAQPVPGVPRN